MFASSYTYTQSLQRSRYSNIFSHFLNTLHHCFLSNRFYEFHIQHRFVLFSSMYALVRAALRLFRIINCSTTEYGHASATSTRFFLYTASLVGHHNPSHTRRANSVPQSGRDRLRSVEMALRRAQTCSEEGQPWGGIGREASRRSWLSQLDQHRQVEWTVVLSI
jgi:hypothetical protein